MKCHALLDQLFIHVPLLTVPIVLELGGSENLTGTESGAEQHEESTRLHFGFTVVLQLPNLMAQLPLKCVQTKHTVYKCAILYQREGVASAQRM